MASRRPVVSGRNPKRLRFEEPPSPEATGGEVSDSSEEEAEVELPLLDDEAEVDERPQDLRALDPDGSDDEGAVDIIEYPPQQTKEVGDKERPYRANDGTLWSTIPPAQPRKPHAEIFEELQRQLTGPKNAALKNVDLPTFNEAYFFKLFLAPNFAKEVVDWTNVYAKAKTDEWNRNHRMHRQRKWRDLDLDEFYAFCAILIRIGARGGYGQPIAEFWDLSDELGSVFCKAAMSRNRYFQISKFLRFDDALARQAAPNRNQLHKLGPIKRLFQQVNFRFRQCYNPGARLTTDETLVRFRGKCPFKVYMPNKPGKYGMKIWNCVDSKSQYCLNMQVYLGKEGNVPERNQGQRVVEELCAPWLNEGRCVIADNFFSSKELAESLLEKNTSYVGTLRSNRKELPPLFHVKKNPTFKARAVGDSQYLYDGDVTLMSMKVRTKSKATSVNLLSTDHHRPHDELVIQPMEREPRYKPKVVLDYNKGKGGVDALDWMIGKYTCQRGTKRWPMKLFYFLLDVIGINSYILWKENYERLAAAEPEEDRRKPLENNARRIFLLELTRQLALPNMKKRALTVSNPGTKKALVSMNVIQPVVPHCPVGPAGRATRLVIKSKKCLPCRPLRNGQNSRTGCSNCAAPICPEHQNVSILCDPCMRRSGPILLRAAPGNQAGPTGGTLGPRPIVVNAGTQPAGTAAVPPATPGPSRAGDSNDSPTSGIPFTRAESVENEVSESDSDDDYI